MIDKTKQKLTAQQSDWLEKLNACNASGKSMKAFALSEGLNLHDLYSWKKTLVKKRCFTKDTPLSFSSGTDQGPDRV